jgi:hypothetical protein
MWRERKKEGELMTEAVVDQSSGARRTALGTLLVERELLSQHQLDEALRLGEENGERLGEVIVRLGWVSEDDLAQVLADQWHLRYFERSAISFDGRALRRMSREDAARLEALPIQEGDDGVIVVALAEPTESRLDALRTLLGDRIDFVVVAKTAIEAGLRSELLARRGGSDEESESSDEPVGQFAEAEAVAEQEDERTDVPEPPVADRPVEGMSTVAFDEIATALTDGLASQLHALRALVVQAEATRERDQQEIARLEAEVSSRQDELDERTEKVRSMQQTLRDYADALDAQA